MHGQGTFEDARLEQSGPVPDRRRQRLLRRPQPGRPDHAEARRAPRLPALPARAPTPPAGSFDAAAAARGQALFNGKAACATCHVPPLFTEPGWNLHLPAEIGIDDFQANRSPTFRYRTSPLRGLWTHAKGGFYHDGRFATSRTSSRHYNSLFRPRAWSRETADLVEYLKSL